MYYIGIDLGGTNIGAGLVDESGKIIMKKSTPTLTERKMEAICQDMIELCQKIMIENDLKREDIGSIGIGTPGLIDSEKGILIYSNNINFNKFEISKVMKEKLGIPVYVGNDADCAALGEVTSGVAKGCNNAIILTLGTGIGGGFIINGKIYSGSFPGAGEVGHHVIVQGGRPCTCGRKGCFEIYASATGLITDAKNAATTNPDSILNKLINGDLNKMNAKTPFDAAQQGDQVGQQVIDDYIGYLATGMANLINIFKPEMIALGGGVAKQKENLIKPLKEKIKKEVYFGDLQTKIEIALLGNDAGIIGAAMLGK